jgi:hypothetical protein
MTVADLARATRGELGADSTNAFPDLVEAIEARLRIPVWLLPLPAGVSGLYAASRGDGYIFRHERRRACAPPLQHRA